MRTWDEIVSIVQMRRSNDASLLARMVDTRDRYHADLVLALTDVDGEPLVPPLGPQVIHDGIEHTAMRAGQTLPTLSVPALDPAQNSGARSVEYAGIRRRAVRANWSYNLMPLILARSFRQLVAYGTFTMAITPDYTDERARIEIRSPLNSYPDPRALEDYRPPRDCAFVYGRSAEFLRHCYGTGLVDRIVTSHPDGDGLWDVCEWIDEDDIVIGVLGPRSTRGLEPAAQTFGGQELRRYPNRCNGLVPVACGKRVTLDRVAGQLEIITGSADWLDKLTALNILAAERNVFPDLYAIAEEGTEVTLAGGKWFDGRTGEINQLAGAKAVGQIVSQSGPDTQVTIAQLERTTRMSGGSIPQFGGEAPGSLRTGRAIGTLGEFSVDPRVAELQHVMEAALSRTVNPAIMEIEKGYWPNKKYVVFSGITSDDYVKYEPEVHFEGTENATVYAFPGMDISTVSVGLLQLTGADMMSKRTARQKHPLIDDPDTEEHDILAERLDESLLIGYQQQVTQGTVPLIDAARVRQFVSAGDHIADAMLKADDEARQRQATMPPPPAPGQTGAPGAMPGLAMPGMGATQGLSPEGPPQIQGPAPSQENLRHFLRTLKAS